MSLPAVNAPLGTVSGVAADLKGNVYVADYDNCMVLRISPDGNLTVIAGNGKPGFSGDGGTAINAKLNGPAGLAADSAGNIYIADSKNNRIRMVTPAGLITTVAGNGTPGFSRDNTAPATNAALNQPLGVAVDSGGNLYIADTLNYRIRSVVINGFITTVAGNGAAGFAGDGSPATSASLEYPVGVALDGAGLLLIADGRRIRKVMSDGTISTVAGNGVGDSAGDGGPALNAVLYQPSGVAVDSAGNWYITEAGGQRVRKVTKADGTIATAAGASNAIPTGTAKVALISYPAGVTADPSNNVFFAESDNYRVRKIAAGGAVSTVAGNRGYRFSGDGGPAISAALHTPSAVLTDASGNILVSDTFNNRVRQISPTGTITTIAGGGLSQPGDGELAVNVALNRPQGLAPYKGHLYIADSLNLREMTSGGTISRIAGYGDPANLNSPTGVAVDAAGNIYVADTLNHRIEMIGTDSTTNKVAGTGAPGITPEGEGTDARSQALNSPGGIAFDASGNLYIADAMNNRIRILTPKDGKMTTFAGSGDLGSSGDGGLATDAKFSAPRGVTVDARGNVFIADTGNNRIRKVTPADHLITTVAGGGTSLGDGGPATRAALNHPWAVAVDAAGNLVIADTDNNRIRKVLGQAPSYQAVPATLSFSAVAGGPSPDPQTVNISSAIPGLAFTTSSSDAWLVVSPPASSMPGAAQVTVDPSKVTAGSYQGTVTITAPDAAPVATNVAVTLKVEPAAGQPVLSVDTQHLSLTGVQGGGDQGAQLRVSNLGSGLLSFTVKATTDSGGSWLSVTPSSGSATLYSTSPVSVTATVGSLAAGTYQGAITVSGGGTNFTVPVTLSVTTPNRVILISQSGLSFIAVSQGGAPLPQSFGILNIGQGSMAWTATASTISGGNWLQISPASGTVQQPYLDVSMVNVTVDSRGLGQGDYYARIQITAAAANSPQIVMVVLTVLPPGSIPGVEVRPTGLIFTGVAGVTPGSQDVVVGNPKGQTDSFVSGSIGKGYTYLPTSANVLPNQPTTVRVFPDYSALSPATVEKGTITLQFANDQPRTITVLSVVAPAGTGGKSPDHLAGSCGSTDLLIQFRSPQQSGQSSFRAIVGQPTTLEVQVADRCGNLVGPGGQAGAAVSAGFSSKDGMIKLTHVGNGVWTGTWRPVDSSQGPVTISVTAFLIQGGTTFANQVTLTGTVAVAGDTPTITAGGVVQAASFAAGVPVAPGSLITIYGTNLADATGSASATPPLPQQLNGAQVRMGDTALPLLYTSKGQMNVQVPFDVPVNTQFQMSVQRGNSLSVPEELVVATAQPGIFTTNQQGTGQGAIVKSDQVTLAQPGTPASIGETVVIYCTGLGAVTPQVAAGQPAPSSPLAYTVNLVTVTIGGKTVTPSFSGLTPGYVGLYQINAVVPSGIATGDAVPVVLSAAGQTSPPVTMAIR